jgi:hypothetical protein
MSSKNLLPVNDTAAKMISVAMVGNDVSKTPRELAVRCEAMKYCFWIANCLDHTASARNVAAATRSLLIPEISCSTKPPILPCRLKWLFS